MNATYEDWQNITSPRIQGAWNLHESLPDLDFFISLSSFLGATGNIGQSIYSGTAVSSTFRALSPHLKYQTPNSIHEANLSQTFFDAFTDYRRARGLPAVAVSLPVVLGVGYVADHDLTDSLKSSLGATLTEPHLRTLIKGAVMGSSSGLVSHDGRVISFSFASGDDGTTEAWQAFHPRALVQRINAESRNSASYGNGSGAHQDGGGDTRSTGLRNANGGDPSVNLLDALISKVSSITMIERDEIEADAPLATYGLDSLVSVELRNWIRRETGVDLPLPNIVGAENLRALAAHILSQSGK